LKSVGRAARLSVSLIMSNMLNITIYFTEGDLACNEVLVYLDELSQEKQFQLTKIDVNSDPAINDKFKPFIPFVLIGPYQLKHPITKTELLVAINAAEDRQRKLENDPVYQERVKRGSELTKTDRFTLWLSRYYLILVSIVLFIYIGVPFLAPVFMENNLEIPAKVVYTIYSPLCHQLAYRSWFLFGEQPFYPRSLANIQGFKTYEEVSNNQPEDLAKGREFLGSPQLGYKVALCERDVAIYGTMLLFSLIFMLSGRRVKSIPWYIWVLVGMVPMGLDGGSQLFSLGMSVFPNWFPFRESSPLLRSITGAMFGVTTMWYVLPIIEESMVDGRNFILRKAAIINHMDKK
jgi:uncharacterized membrane protein